MFRAAIVHVMVSAPMLALLAAPLPALATDSSIPFILADLVHADGITGQGVTVAVIDTGIDSTHPGLGGSIAEGGISIVHGARVYDDGGDIWDYGHGTYMSLIITDATGVAPGARVLSIRVFGAWGADARDVATAIRYVTARRNVDPTIRVINLSLGGGSYGCSCDGDDPATQAYAAAISTAANAGIITFAATGNEADCGEINRPACVSAAVRVAANYDDDYPTVNYGICGDFEPPAYYVTCFSNIAEDCDWLLAAPGYDITVGGFGEDDWGAGTSQATAHCSGVAALMFEKNACGGLSAGDARIIIFDTAWDFTTAFP